MAELQLKASTVEVSDWEEAVETCYRMGWTDGLPVLPPTRERVEKVLRGAKRNPQEVLGIVPPRNGIATVEQVAINAAMAGCLPEYLPVIIAALQGLLEPAFNLNGVQCTTHNSTPITIVGGPVVKELGFHCRDGVFGGSSRASATVGRAIRLILWNIGGAHPGEITKTTLGSPARYLYCIAENQEDSPWEPLHVERGLKLEDSAVTVFACEAPHSIMSLAPEGRLILDRIASAMAAPGSNNMQSLGQMLVVIGPESVQVLGKEGWSRSDVKTYLYEHSHVPLTVAMPFPSIFQRWPKWVNTQDPATRVPVVSSPGDIILMVSGGMGVFSACCPGWGISGGFAQTKRIDR